MLTGHSTEKVIATVQAANEADVDKAVQAAKAALTKDTWKLLPGSDRGLLMSRLADLLEKKRELFATIDAWDNGMISGLPSHMPMPDLIEDIQESHIKKQSRATSLKPLLLFAIMPDGLIRLSVRPSALLTRNLPTLFDNRSVSLLKSSLGTTHFAWLFGS